jgi:hypothetical protein
VRLPHPARNFARAALAGVSLACAAAAAVPPSLDEISTVCGSGAGPENCARRIEAVQLKRLPNLAKRDGAALIVSLYPSGSTTFVDADTPRGERTYSLFDYLSEINAVVLFVTDGAESSFALLQRVTGRETGLPSDPRLSPDRQFLLTADFCSGRCTGEVAVWRVTRDGVFKAYAWRPRERWIDAAATWKDAGTIAIEFTPVERQREGRLERRLSDADWIRFPVP